MVEGFDRYTTIDDLLKDVDVIGYLLKRDVLFKTNIKKIRGLRKIESYKHAIIEGEVFVGNNVVIQPYTYIIGPVCLMDDVCIGPGSFIRHNTFIGEGSYIGYGNEISNSIV